MKKQLIWTLAIGLAATISVATVTAQQDDSPQVQHRLIPPSKARHPGPPSDDWDRGHKSSIGKGPVSVTTAQPVTFWQEQLAIGGSFRAEVKTDFLYDPNIGIIYGYRDGDFECKNGQAANAPVLEALYTVGNRSGKPTASGWYAVDLKAGKCGAKQAGVYGCKFDSSGSTTDCGMATINSQTGEIELTPAQ